MDIIVTLLVLGGLLAFRNWVIKKPTKQRTIQDEIAFWEIQKMIRKSNH